MKKMTYIVMALALVLGLAQCKKEEMPASNQPEGFSITLDVKGGNDGSKVNVDPTGNNGEFNYATVTFEEGDIIYVANDGKYRGYLTYHESKFTGTISGTDFNDEDYLHFYFMGNKGTTSEPTSVSITDQTTKYPVISYAHSTKKFNWNVQSYSAKLQNYCSIVKFTTPDIAGDITVKGMKNTVSVNFAANNAAASTPTLDVNPYTPGQSGDGDIILHAESSTERWAILLVQNQVNGATVTAPFHENGSCNVPAITNNTYYNGGVSISGLTPKVIDLATVTGHTTIQDGYRVIGTLNGNYKISIADGATVTLSDINITCLTDAGDWAGITCEGDATVTLEGTNNVKNGWGGKSCIHPGIEIPEGKTLTINGSGAINASGYNVNPESLERWGSGAGIGGANKTTCGNIIIESGTVLAEGGVGAAGIGSGMGGSIGNITIYGGTITAKGGDGGAGIGCGFGNDPIIPSSCGEITISGGNVTATGGQWAAGIGSGLAWGFGQSSSFGISTSTCGNIRITGGTVVATGGDAGSVEGLGLEPDYCDGGAGIGTGASVNETQSTQSEYPSTRAGKSNCGDITIDSGVTSVTATKGSSADNSIGKNHSNNPGTCGTVTIGGVVGAITSSPYTYQPQ